MKIETAKLKSFLNKTIMSGAEELEEGILKFDKEGLKIQSASTST